MPSRLDFRRGDLVVAMFGRDYGKPRPALVIQSDLFNESHSSTVLCPISSELTGLALFRVRLPAAAGTGLRAESEVMVDKIAAVDRNRVRQRIGRLSGDQMSKIDTALRRWLDLERSGRM